MALSPTPSRIAGGRVTTGVLIGVTIRVTPQVGLGFAQLLVVAARPNPRGMRKTDETDVRRPAGV